MDDVRGEIFVSDYALHTISVINIRIGDSKILAGFYGKERSHCI